MPALNQSVNLGWIMMKRKLYRGSLLMCALVAACSNDSSPTIEDPLAQTPGSGRNEIDCQPYCPPGLCGDDGCGGECGCTDPQLSKCNAERVCVSEAECTDTCVSAGLQCGSVCNTSCGTCSTGECIWGSCVTVPTNASCTACLLKLRVLGRVGNQVRLGIDLTSNTPLPRMADLRIYTNYNGAFPVSAVAGSALWAAGKELYIDPIESTPFRVVGTRTYGVLALSLANTTVIHSGTLAEVIFDIGALNAGDDVAFRLEQRPKTFAPASADLILQSGRYDYPVAVER